jgi:hypothetical protein
MRLQQAQWALALAAAQQAVTASESDPTWRDAAVQSLARITAAASAAAKR